MLLAAQRFRTPTEAYGEGTDTTRRLAILRASLPAHGRDSLDHIPARRKRSRASRRKPAREHPSRSGAFRHCHRADSDGLAGLRDRALGLQARGEPDRRDH